MAHFFFFLDAFKMVTLHGRGEQRSRMFDLYQTTISLWCVNFYLPALSVPFTHSLFSKFSCNTVRNLLQFCYI